MTHQPLDFVPDLRHALIQGYANIAQKLNEIAKANNLSLINAPIAEMNFRQSKALFAACLPAIRSIALLPAADNEICPWTLGFINGRNNKPWHIPLLAGAEIENVFEFMASWDKRRFEVWETNIIEPVNEHHQEWLEWIDRVEQPDEIESVAKLLSKNGSRGGSIFRFLASRPSGVTFSEFKDYRDSEKRPLTGSVEIFNIAAILRRLSGKLSKYGWELEVSPAGDLIKAKKIRK